MAKHLGVQYIYVETKPVLNIPPAPEMMSLNLTIMSPNWISQLYEAALEANGQMVSELIKEIPDSEIYLIQLLTQTVRKFAFEQIIDLVEPLINNDS